MGVTNAIFPIPLTSFDTTALNTTFKAINSTGTTEPCFLIRIVNDSDADITISYDGSNDHDFLRTGKTLQLPLQTNAQPNNMMAKLRRGTTVWIKGSGQAGFASGLVYLSGYYQNQG